MDWFSRSKLTPASTQLVKLCWMVLTSATVLIWGIRPISSYHVVVDRKLSISLTWTPFLMPRANLTSSMLLRVQIFSLRSKLASTLRSARLSSSRTQVQTRVSEARLHVHRYWSDPGGVTSSSLEVLAGLALSTEDYTNFMIFKDSKPSPFYQNYVKDIQAIIAENATSEFQCIWREHARLGGTKPRTQISDELSSTLNNLQAELENSDLFDDEPSRRGVMRRAIPKTLVNEIGLDALLKRLPESYQRALFSSWVSSHFVCLHILSQWHCWPSFLDLQVWCQRF